MDGLGAFLAAPYPRVVRRFLVLLMIIVMPLRAAAGDLMSLSMGTHSSSTPSASMPADCEMHLGAGDVRDGDVAAAPAGTECGTCALCLPVAHCPGVSVVRGDLPDAAPAPGEERFLSVPARLGLRPPSL
jgi:hypothetical protein